MSKFDTNEEHRGTNEPAPDVNISANAADSKTPSDVPEQPPPPPDILTVLYQLKEDNLRAAFRRIAEDIQALIEASGLVDSYNFLFLYDEQSSISERTSNKLYAAASGDFVKKDLPNFLLLHTNGGSPVPAYVISRYLKTASPHGFIAVIPRRAKSAGTLIALGAREIHMGMMSELGPVDPQISDLPALGLGSALDYIAGICEKHPGSAEMLAKYLQANLNIHHLGLFERVSESATHYAEKLLRRESLSAEKSAGIAKDLVYGYKDHSFAIDCDEIKGILGDEIELRRKPQNTNWPTRFISTWNWSIWISRVPFAILLYYRLSREFGNQGPG